jgi:hypothetical protein
LFDIFRFRILPDAAFLKIHYGQVHHKELNLKNPVLLNEKIQWLKLHNDIHLLTMCADKFKVRDYVKNKVGPQYLIPLVYETKDLRTINASTLPDYPVIIKTNHNSGGNIIVRDKTQLDYPQIHKKLKRLLKENFYYTTKENQYKNIERRIIVEKLLVDESGNVPMDYKFHCLNGKVEFIQMDVDRFTNHKRNFYDIHWNLLPFSWCPHIDGKPIWENSDRVFKAPETLSQMIEIAEKLATDFNYVRVDLYYHIGKVYFGELTFHHGGGNEIFNPLEYDEIFGQKLHLRA